MFSALIDCCYGLFGCGRQLTPQNEELREYLLKDEKDEQQLPQENFLSTENAAILLLDRILTRDFPDISLINRKNSQERRKNLGQLLQSKPILYDYIKEKYIYNNFDLDGAQAEIEKELRNEIESQFKEYSITNMSSLRSKIDEVLTRLDESLSGTQQHQKESKVLLEDHKPRNGS